MIETFRNGQWILCDSQVEGTHRSKSGKAVGIFCKGGQTQLGNWLPDAIALVNEAGETVLRIGANQSGLEPLLDIDDHPPGRSRHPAWKPRP